MRVHQNIDTPEPTRTSPGRETQQKRKRQIPSAFPLDDPSTVLRGAPGARHTHLGSPARSDWSHLSVLPRSSFHAIRPLALPPTSTPAAADALLKRKSCVKTKPSLVS